MRRRGIPAKPRGTFRLSLWDHGLLRVEDGESFQHRDLAQGLVRGDEMVDQSLLPQPESNGQLHRVERAKPQTERILFDEALG